MNPGIIALAVTGAGAILKGCSSTKPMPIPRPGWDNVFTHYPDENDVCFFSKYFGYNGNIVNGQIMYKNRIIESGAARISIALINSGMKDVFNEMKTSIGTVIPYNKKGENVTGLSGCKIIGTAEGLNTFLRKGLGWSNVEGEIANPYKKSEVNAGIIGNSVEVPSNGIYIILGRKRKNHATLWISAKEDVIDNVDNNYKNNNYIIDNYNQNKHMAINDSIVYFWELKYNLPETCWILSTGSNVYWYAGKYGNKAKLMHVFNASSGVTRDKSIASQGKIGRGPTVEGDYELNIKPAPKPATVKIVGVSGGKNLYDLQKDEYAGIEQIISKPPEYNFEDDWGNNRVRLIPSLETAKKIRRMGREENSFYFHDSKKGYTSGCTEVNPPFFEILTEYRKKMEKNEEIKVKVMVKYPENNSTICE